MMKQYLLLIVLFTFIGCTIPPLLKTISYEPLSHPDQRILLDEFSFLPPNGENWEVRSRPLELFRNFYNWGRSSEKSMNFKKRVFGQNRAPDEAKIGTTSASAIKYEFFIMNFDNEDDLKEFANRAYTDHDELGGVVYENNSSLENFNGMNCVRHNGKLGHGRYRGSKDSANIHYIQGYTCVHPRHPNHVISLEAVQVVWKGQTPTDIQSELDHFFNSLKLH